MNKITPFFSIIIAVKNPANELLLTIKSIQNQKYRDFEIIVIDSNSNLNWEFYFGSLYKSIDIFISENDTGIYNAWNKGVSSSTGEWLIFLGAGDLLFDANTLHDYYHACLINHHADYIYGNIEMTNSNEKIIKPWYVYQHKIVSEMPIPHVGMLHNKSLFMKNGMFNEHFKICGDYEFFLRTCIPSRVCYLQDLTTVKMEPGGISANPISSLKIIKEIYLAKKINKSTIFNFYYLKNVIIYLARYLKYLAFKTRNSKNV